MHNKCKQGMTLIEVVVALFVLTLVISALTALSLRVVGLAQSSRLRNLATRCAEARIENIKVGEQKQEFKLEIQRGDWTNFIDSFTEVQDPNNPSPSNGNANDCDPIGKDLYFTRSTTMSVSGDINTVTVTVYWPDRGQLESLNLITRISKWQ